eukprot:COSAG02_NODE_8000_length_2753_cov_1.836096_2_plen_400_part_00
MRSAHCFRPSATISPMDEHYRLTRFEEHRRARRGFSHASNSITIVGDDSFTAVVDKMCDEIQDDLCSVVCNKTRIDAADDVSLCCEILVETSAMGEIYFGVAPDMVLLDGCLHDRCPGWLGLRLADGGIWSGPDGLTGAECEQLLGSQSWMHEATTVGGSGGAPFVAAGDRIRLEMLPTTDMLVVSKNDVEQGRVPLPRATCMTDSLQWIVTMAQHGDSVRISFPKSVRPPPEPVEQASTVRPVDAGISYRRLVRRHICRDQVIGSEVIYEVLFMASASELKRFGIGTLLVNQLKHLLAGEKLEPQACEEGVSPMKRSLCVSIKSASNEALSFWTAMGLCPVSTSDPVEKQLLDVMVPFADFTPVAASWANIKTVCQERGLDQLLEVLEARRGQLLSQC